MSRKIIIVCMLATLTTPFVALAQQSDKLTIDLFLDWEYVSNPKISPTSEVIVYIRRVTDKINDKYTNEIWIVNVDGRRNRFLVKDPLPSGHGTVYGWLILPRENRKAARFSFAGWTVAK